MTYNRAGKVDFTPEISLGLWHILDVDCFQESINKIHYAFDKGINFWL